MIKDTIKKMSRDIGYDIGQSDDETQSELLNGLCEAIHDSMLQKSDREMQLCYIAKKLNKKSRLIIKSLTEFINLNEDELKC